MSRDRSLESMHAVVCAATEALDLRELSRLALPPLARAFDTSIALCYEVIDGRLVGYMDGDGEVFARYLDYAGDDPLQAVKLRHNPCVAVTTDMVGANALRRTALYADVLRRYDAEHHLVLRISDIGYGESGVTSLVLARSRHQPVWSDRDAGDLLRLRPALTAFYRRWARWRGAGTRSNPAQLAFDLAGRLLWLSPEADALLGGAARLPAALHTAAGRLGAMASAGEVPRSLTVDLDTHLDGRRLSVSLHLVGAEERSFVLARVNLTPLCVAVDAAAALHALSPAETEVLRELARGATNAEIGRRLCISPHTVRTHLMHIFPKLGVHTRAAALARIGEILATPPRR